MENEGRLRIVVSGAEKLFVALEVTYVTHAFQTALQTSSNWSQKATNFAGPQHLQDLLVSYEKEPIFWLDSQIVFWNITNRDVSSKQFQTK